MYFVHKVGRSPFLGSKTAKIAKESVGLRENTLNRPKPKGKKEDIYLLLCFNQNPGIHL